MHTNTTKWRGVGIWMVKLRHERREPGFFYFYGRIACLQVRNERHGSETFAASRWSRSAGRNPRHQQVCQLRGGTFHHLLRLYADFYMVLLMPCCLFPVFDAFLAHWFVSLWQTWMGSDQCAVRRGITACLDAMIEQNCEGYQGATVSPKVCLQYLN